MKRVNQCNGCLGLKRVNVTGATALRFRVCNGCHRGVGLKRVTVTGVIEVPG